MRKVLFRVTKEVREEYSGSPSLERVLEAIKEETGEIPDDRENPDPDWLSEKFNELQPDTIEDLSDGVEYSASIVDCEGPTIFGVADDLTLPLGLEI